MSCLNAPFAHHLSGRRVADERGLEAMLPAFPHREARALQQRAGFVGPDVRALAAASELQNDGQCRAFAAGRQRARVAVREDARARRERVEQIGAVARDGRALDAVLLVNGACFGQ